MQRTPEPELMDDAAQARAYSEADFAEPHEAFVDHVLARFPELARADVRVLDLGCGPADVTARVARRLTQAHIVGVDGSEPMLALGRERLAAAGLDSRVELRCALLPDDRLTGDGPFDVVVSNSLLHHLHDPAVIWDAVATLAAPAAPVVVMDLRRPADAATVDALVERYAAGEPDVLVADFGASLHAAFTPEEVEAQLAAAGLGHLAVEVVSDRHLVVSGRR
jgi:2-polyprenyl-3-methyl-5-hydroxy-6-metoxy-1,4-benzoquinol methylase